MVFNATRRRVLALLSGLAAGLAVPAGASPAAADQTIGDDDMIRILAFGDSLVAGWGIDPENAFPARLEAALRAEGYPVQILDGGVSGDTTAGGRARLDWLLAGLGDDAIDGVIVELGANDGLRGTDPAETEANLEAILKTLDRRGLPVLLTGMYAPPNFGREYAEAFNAIYPRLAERFGVLFYPFFLKGVAAEPRLNQADGIHPNPAGVAVIVENILPSARALIERVRAGRQAAG